jgi:hypothetical protein
MSHSLRLGIQRNWERHWALSVGVVVIAAGAGVAACQNRDTGGGTGGGGTGAGTSNGGSTPSTGSGSGVNGMLFTPAGCDFTIAERPEYNNWGASTPVVGATPNIRRVRLGLGGNVQPGSKGLADPSTSIAMAWQTDTGTDVTQVQWGTTSDPTTWPATNLVSGITWDTPPGSINGTDGAEHMHEAYICGLKPATTYYYRVGGGATVATGVWSNVFSFTTTPAAGATPVTIAITGDSRGENTGGLAPAGINTWQTLQQRLKTIAPTLALFSGDVINLAPDQGEWEEWLDKAELDTDGKTPLTLPTLLSLNAHGNHDNHSALFYGNLVLPQDNATYPTYGELFYSFDVGPVHVLVMDNMYITDGGDDNYQPALTKWLNADLTAANANRANVPWIITVHHYPDYDSSLHSNEADVLADRAYFPPIWQQYHVDMAFSGHDHDYERTKPLNVGSDVNSPTATTDADGTTYVVCAGSGADPYSSGTSPFTAISANFSTGALGIYGILKATSTTLTLTAHNLTADGSDPVIDTYTITK